MTTEKQTPALSAYIAYRAARAAFTAARAAYDACHTRCIAHADYASTDNPYTAAHTAARADLASAIAAVNAATRTR